MHWKDKTTFIPVIFAIIVFLAIIFYYSEVKEFSTTFVTIYGLIGLFIAVIILEIFIQPISSQYLIFAATFGGSNLYATVLVAGAASILMGTLHYNISRKLGKDRLQKLFGKKYIKKGEVLMKKHGFEKIAIGILLTPVPYKTICWIAGIYKFKFSKFFITIVATRIPRFFIVALIGYLI
ncbi:MAG: VTT domain-containing protein [Nanoarchaeota archaeon]|nr:VTT domain-containing protein [Nanoarchaeota archaeon]